MITGYFSRLRHLRVRIAHVEKSEPWFSTPNIVSLPLDITGLTLVVLAVWLGAALVLDLTYYLALLMILALVAALPSTLRLTLSYSRTEQVSTEPPSI
jgi:hypothetical protein